MKVSRVFLAKLAMAGVGMTLVGLGLFAEYIF
jgi:hypothetical protein